MRVLDARVGSAIALLSSALFGGCMYRSKDEAPATVAEKQNALEMMPGAAAPVESREEEADDRGGGGGKRRMLARPKSKVALGMLGDLAKDEAPARPTWR